MLVRAYRTGDAVKVAQLLGLDALSRGTHRIVVAEEAGTVKGAALWDGEPGGTAQLGDVATAGLMDPANDRTIFYTVIRACALAAIDEGFTLATFNLRDSQLLARIQRDFAVAPTVIGREPSKDGDGAPRTWEITVDLNDAVEQLDGALARLARP